jgi:phenylacetic acid degradation operon negative regulatory protein
MSKNGVRPQSLIFTLFGDYIRYRDNRIRIGSLVKLLALAGVSEPAVRTTVSRMVRRGWLESERVGKTSFYVFTSQARKLIEEGALRIFDFSAPPDQWNGCWHLVTYSIPEAQRDARDQFRRELGWLGYGMLANAVWVSPYNQRAGVEELVTALGIKPHVQVFSAQLEGFISAEQVVARCWNLGALNAEYAAFIEKYAQLFADLHARAGAALDDSEYFARRLLLIHEYRRFPYRDPHLPLELLPHDWHGRQAAALFHKYHEQLAERANKYFEAVFE